MEAKEQLISPGGAVDRSSINNSPSGWQVTRLGSPPLGSSMSCEARAALSWVRRVLQLERNVARASISEGRVPGAAGILVEVRGLLKDGRGPLQVAKEALLSVCASPPSIFILGRAFGPFRDFGDMGFSACIVSLRSWKARHACWNTILNGFCAGLECSSYHPCAEDMLRLVVRAKQVDFSTDGY